MPMKSFSCIKIQKQKTLKKGKIGTPMGQTGHIYGITGTPLGNLNNCTYNSWNQKLQQSRFATNNMYTAVTFTSFDIIYLNINWNNQVAEYTNL